MENKANNERNCKYTPNINYENWIGRRKFEMFYTEIAIIFVMWRNKKKNYATEIVISK